MRERKAGMVGNGLAHHSRTNGIPCGGFGGHSGRSSRGVFGGGVFLGFFRNPLRVRFGASHRRVDRLFSRSLSTEDELQSRGQVKTMKVQRMALRVESPKMTASGVRSCREDSPLVSPRRSLEDGEVIGSHTIPWGPQSSKCCPASGRLAGFG